MERLYRRVSAGPALIGAWGQQVRIGRVGGALPCKSRANLIVMQGACHERVRQVGRAEKITLRGQTRFLLHRFYIGCNCVFRIVCLGHFIW